MNILLLLLGCVFAVPVAYIWLIALASVRMCRTQPSAQPGYRFAITIPAHDEETVIANTVWTMRQMDYPQEMFDIFVAADHCSDHTVDAASGAGAIVFERNDGPRTGKGAVLVWLYNRIFASERTYDAVVVFDADTQVDPQFLRFMDARLRQGAQVVQGCHRILNPRDSWFAALTWAMFIIDNRFQNLGRANLGWSAKNMGDSICFRVDIVRRFGSGEGLTEDYELRQRLLLDGIKIEYEPEAISYGEAAVNWTIAQSQRARWLSGTYRATKKHAYAILIRGLASLDGALLDGALQAYLPSYSTYTLIAIAGLFIDMLLFTRFNNSILEGWAALLIALGIYPFFGLFLERAPARAYIAIWLGPMFIVWRTWLSIKTRFIHHDGSWVRTKRRDSMPRHGTKK